MDLCSSQLFFNIIMLSNTEMVVLDFPVVIAQSLYESWAHLIPTSACDTNQQRKLNWRLLDSKALILKFNVGKSVRSPAKVKGETITGG